MLLLFSALQNCSSTMSTIIGDLQDHDPKKSNYELRTTTLDRTQYIICSIMGIVQDKIDIF